MSWFTSAVDHIQEVTKNLPRDLDLQERMKIVDAAYPFGERRYTPYKMWLKARRQYLARYGYRVETPLLDVLSPLDKAAKRGKEQIAIREMNRVGKPRSRTGT